MQNELNVSRSKPLGNCFPNNDFALQIRFGNKFCILPKVSLEFMLYGDILHVLHALVVTFNPTLNREVNRKSHQTTAGQAMSNMPLKDEHNIFKSPFAERVRGMEVPNIPLTDFLFQTLDTNYEVLKDSEWVVDVVKGTSYKFSDIKPVTKKIASALTRMGFKKGDILYFVTYDMALIYAIQIAVWLCGGAVRGSFQRECKEEFERQMREIKTKFVLCDAETSQDIKWAVEQIDWPIHLLSIGGGVDDATAVEVLIETDDGSAFPHDVEINPKEDVIAMPNTSGSTGFPKGAMHTHLTLLTFLKSLGAPFNLKNGRPFGSTLMTLTANFSIATLTQISTSIVLGFTFYSTSKFDKKTFLKLIAKYKPTSLFLYPYILNWMSREPELDNYDFSFIKVIANGGSVTDITTCRLLSSRLPHVKLTNAYAMTEAILISTTELGQLLTEDKGEEERISGLKIKKLDDEEYVSSGLLLPLVEAKIVDPASENAVGYNTKGQIWIRTPYLMKGYLNSSNRGDTASPIDKDGWFETGDMGFIDSAGHIYIAERKSSIFKYYMHMVSPSELEAVIGNHPAVLSVAVVGIPNPETTTKAKAFVVLKPNYKVSEEEITKYVAERKVFYKHLHGGVQFVENLPMNRGGKLDRTALLEKALAESKLVT